MKKLLLALAGVVMTASSAFAAANQLYGIGAIDGWGSWNPAQGKELTKVSDGVFTVDVTISGTTYFAFTEQLGDWTTVNAHRYAPAANDTPVIDGDNEMKYGKDASWKIGPGEYTFTINTNTLVLNVKETGSVEKVITYDIWGAFATDEWASTPMVATEGNNDEWTAIINAKKTGVEFGIRELTNGSQSDWFACGFSYDGFNGDNAILNGDPEGNCLFDLPEGKDYKFTFVPSTKKLTVSEYAGVSDITVDDNAPEQYYTLQGVQVTTPVAGNLYIVRQGTKVSKICVK